MREAQCDRCTKELGNAKDLSVLSEAMARKHDIPATVYFPRSLDIGRKLVQMDFCTSCLDDLENWVNEKKFEARDEAEKGRGRS